MQKTRDARRSDWGRKGKKRQVMTGPERKENRRVDDGKGGWQK